MISSKVLWSIRPNESSNIVPGMHYGMVPVGWVQPTFPKARQPNRSKAVSLYLKTLASKAINVEKKFPAKQKLGLAIAKVL